MMNLHRMKQVGKPFIYKTKHFGFRVWWPWLKRWSDQDLIKALAREALDNNFCSSLEEYIACHYVMRMNNCIVIRTDKEGNIIVA